LAAPVMDLVESGFKLAQGFILGQLGETLMGKFLGNGIIASFSSVLVFVP
jgi:Fe2+ transport system protein B